MGRGDMTFDSDCPGCFVQNHESGPLILPVIPNRQGQDTARIMWDAPSQDAVVCLRIGAAQETRLWFSPQWH